MKLDFSGLKILVIGDPMWDCYHFGHVDRISPEAPVPVFVEDDQEHRFGGAANVLEQLKALKCEVVSGWPWDTPYSGDGWTMKRRFLVGSHQLLRVDTDRCVPNTIPSLNGFHAIVISDYAKGACTPEICQEAIKSGLTVIVDPKGKDWRKYEGATLICPNEREVVEGSDQEMIIKRGPLGLRWWLPPDFVQDFEAKAKRVFDVTGAGDCVVAVVAACVAKGISLPTACKLANAAAGYVVGEVGTTVCPLDVLCAYAETL